MPVLPRASVAWAAVQGFAALAIAALALILGSRIGIVESELRALVFTVLVLMNFGLILVNRSFRTSFKETVLRPNAMLWALAGGVLAVLGLALYWPPAQALFHFGPLHWYDLAFCFAAGVGLVTLLEFGKWVSGEARR
jgi:Ca2+-transporting ATPase